MTTQADAGNKLFADDTIKLIDKMENELAKAKILIARQDRQIQQLKKATKTITAAWAKRTNQQTGEKEKAK